MSEVDLPIRLLMLPDGRAVCICYTTTGGCGGGRGGSVAVCNGGRFRDVAYNEAGLVWACVRLRNLDPDVNKRFSMLGRRIADGAMMVSENVVVGVAQASSGVSEPQ